MKIRFVADEVIEICFQKSKLFLALKQKLAIKNVFCEFIIARWYVGIVAKMTFE